MKPPSPHTIQAVHYATGEPVEVVVEQGMIKEINRLPEPVDISLPYIAPGLTDLQVNGYQGFDFNSSRVSISDVVSCTRLLLAQGVTTYFPTVITHAPAHMQASLHTIAAACLQSDEAAACIGGIHLEGPFISPLNGPRGAHDRQFVQAPDWELFEAFYEASGGRIKIVTLSPEWPEAVSFIRRCVERGVLVSIGHTAAGSEQIEAAVQAGASLSTHLGNGAHPVLPRHPNYIWDQLASEGLAASFIGDGFHLPLSVIKTILQVKGPGAILVSDSVSLAGMPPGTYTTPVGGEVVLTEGGKLYLKNHPGMLAGSARSLIEAVGNLCSWLPDKKPLCWNLASLHPARLLGMPQQQGLRPGAPADLLMYEEKNGRPEIMATYKGGMPVYVKGSHA